MRDGTLSFWAVVVKLVYFSGNGREGGQKARAFDLVSISCEDGSAISGHYKYVEFVLFKLLHIRALVLTFFYFVSQKVGFGIGIILYHNYNY